MMEAGNMLLGLRNDSNEYTQMSNKMGSCKEVICDDRHTEIFL